MIKEDCRIIFIGTPQFAATTLQAILENGMNVVAVITAPDKPAGRGLQLHQSDVKKLALQYNIPVLQPEKLKNIDFINQLKSFNATLQIVVAFRMLPEVIWDMPPLGTINLHASLLPNYRGAAPINWAIINGEKTTGITTFKLQHQIDTGNILLQQEIEILETDDAGSLHDKLMINGANLIVKTIEQLLDNNLKEIPQTVNENTKHAPKIYTTTCQINWNTTAENIVQLIKGLSPYPCAFCLLNDKKIKIYNASFSTYPKPSIGIGQYETDGKTFLKFGATNGLVSILDLQIEGKKRLKIEEFLRGVKL